MPQYGIDNLAFSMPGVGTNWANANGDIDAFDMSTLNSTFRPDGSFHPWLTPGCQNQNWSNLAASDGLGGLGLVPDMTTIPDLIPDNSQNNTPPNLLILPPELQDTTRSHHHNHVEFPSTSQSANQHAFNGAGTSTALLLDPFLNTNHSNMMDNTDMHMNAMNDIMSSIDLSTMNNDNNNTSNNNINSNKANNSDNDSAIGTTNDTNLGLPSHLAPSCACLSALFLYLTSLNQEATKPATFPFALHSLRPAMQSALQIMDCEECPQRFMTAIQNTQLLGALIMSIADRFTKILVSITKEAEQAAHKGEDKAFRLADLNTSTAHLHTGGLSCAAAFNVHLSPEEWRKMAKKVVKAEVYGSNNDCCVYYMQLVEKMEKRHTHYEHRKLPDDFPVDHRTGLQLGGKNLPKEDHVCLKYAEMGRRLLEGADWE
jgi:hypothetical protein